MTTTLSDPSTVLGVAPDASRTEVRRAYRRLVKAYHPDRNPDPDAAEKFRLVQEAYEALTADDGAAEPEAAPTDDQASEPAERAARAQARAEAAQRARAERRRDRLAEARRIMARRVPDAHEVEACELTGWSYRPTFEGVAASLVAVYDDETDTFAVLLVDLADVAGAVAVDDLVDDRLLPIGPRGRCPSLDDALDRSFFWLTRQAWRRGRLPLRQPPAADLAEWARGEAGRVLALLGVAGQPGADAVIADELGRLARLITTHSTGDSVRSYLRQLIDWTLTQEVSQWQ